MGNMICGNIAAAIVAGGKNSRFGGQIKANAIIDGEKIIDKMVHTLREIFDEIVVVTNTPEEFSGLTNCRIAGDQFKEIGPLGGIHSAMVNSTKDSVFIFACDMPYISRKLILRQCGYFFSHLSDAIIPETGNGLEPLHGIYLTSLAKKLEDHIRNTSDYNIRLFLDKINTATYKPQNLREALKAFTNINTPPTVV